MRLHSVLGEREPGLAIHLPCNIQYSCAFTMHPGKSTGVPGNCKGSVPPVQVLSHLMCKACNHPMPSNCRGGKPLEESPVRVLAIDPATDANELCGNCHGNHSHKSFSQGLVKPADGCHASLYKRTCLDMQAGIKAARGLGDI